jgi:carbamoylphosphate synthase large subunit
VRILGTHPDQIDNAENRQKFSALLDRVGVDQPVRALTRIRLSGVSGALLGV